MSNGQAKIPKPSPNAAQNWQDYLDFGPEPSESPDPKEVNERLKRLVRKLADLNRRMDELAHHGY
jgi:hypothetical protein